MVPLLPESLWEFHDSFVPSETAGPRVFSTNVMKETFSVKRLPGSRTIRDLPPKVEPQNLDFDVNVFFGQVRYDSYHPVLNPCLLIFASVPHRLSVPFGAQC